VPPTVSLNLRSTCGLNAYFCIIIAQPCLGSTRERSFVFVITNPRKKLAVTFFLLFPVFSSRNRFSTNTTTNTVRCDSFLVSRTYVRVQLLARLT
jgi:hypothetical protein